MSKLLSAATILLAPLAVVLALRPDRARMEPDPWIHRDGGFVGSSACASCHPEHEASWARTFHRTMTQRPGPDTILGAFDGRTVSFAGRSAHPTSEGGRYFVEVPAEGSGSRRAEVALVVGSRRYQQYFEREVSPDGSVLRRLPILWHVGARRWLPLDAVFLNPEGNEGDGGDDHRAVWDENCIFCHNTGPEPRLQGAFDGRLAARRVYDSRVAEFGIACEACHGPGAAHVAGLRDPLIRYGAHVATEPRADVVQPERRDQERAVSVCGQCHGQRVPAGRDTPEAWLTTGPLFRSGDRLLDHVRPLAPDTPVPANADPDLFRLRFWADGTPRLTAYEYQGIVASGCYLRGAMTCGSCHEMHGANEGRDVDVHGQIEPSMRGDRACVQCHDAIGRDVAAHTKHDPARSGSRCLECHMPRTVYGIAEVHRSHRIRSPDPAAEAEAGVPDACTLCHLDRSPAWAARERARMWGGPERAPASRPDGASTELPDSIASVLAGDAVQRAVFAAAMGRTDAPIAPADKAFARVHLAVTLGDAYPSVRWLAQRSLEALERELPIGLAPALASFDFTEGPESRRKTVLDLLDLVAARSRAALAPAKDGLLLRPDGAPDLPAIVPLTERQLGRAISIGE
jgi:hypothetical protein